MAFKRTTESVDFVESEDTDLDVRLLGLAGLNPFTRHNSSPRQAMMNKHLGQMLVFKDPEIRRISSGLDREFGKYTHNVKFENNSTVLKVIPKYPSSARFQNINYNPLTTVIYENADSDNQLIDVKQIPTYHSMHQYFGFDYKRSPKFNELIREGSAIGAGTVVADSPNKDEYGNYKFGINAKVAYTSSHGGIEDGITVSDEFIKRLTTTVFDTRTISFGSKDFPLNINGDEKEFKVIPDVGERIREDGVLAVLRELDPELAPCDLSVEAMQTPNTFDEYVYGYPDAEIVDVTIYHNPSNKDIMFTGTEDQLIKYRDAQTRYYKSLLDYYRKLRKDNRKGKVNISNELHRLLSHAHAMADAEPSLKYNEKGTELDIWTLHVTFRYEITPGIGSKITDLSG